MGLSSGIRNLTANVGRSKSTSAPVTPIELFHLHETARRSAANGIDSPTLAGPVQKNPTIASFRLTPQLPAIDQVADIGLRKNSQTRALIETTSKALDRLDDDAWFALLRADIAGVPAAVGGTFHVTLTRQNSYTVSVNVGLPGLDRMPSREPAPVVGQVGRPMSPKAVSEHWLKMTGEIILGCGIRVHALLPFGFATSVVTNGYMTYLDPRTGRFDSRCVGTVALDTASIASINPAQVDPMSAVEFLGGAIASDGPTGGSVVPATEPAKTSTDDAPTMAIRNSHDAEILTARYMQWLGHTDAKELPIGPDGGIDVNSSTAVAQVKAHMNPIGIAEIQRHHGVAAAENKQSLFFAMSYSRSATTFADSVDMPLFSFDYLGKISAYNRSAETHVAECRSVHAEPKGTNPANSQLPPAGWYEDPEGQQRLRYYDGTQWTSHYAE